MRGTGQLKDRAGIMTVTGQDRTETGVRTDKRQQSTGLRTVKRGQYRSKDR